jgi:hypothetical protein
VDSPQKADIIIEVSAPEDSSGTSVSSSTKTSPYTGRPEQSTTSTKQISTTSDVVLVVRDARTGMRLWSASEHVKSAMKKKGDENNLVKAAEKLVEKLHDRLEPPEEQKK